MSHLHLPWAIKAINSVLLQQALGRGSSLLCSSIWCTWSFTVFPLPSLFQIKSLPSLWSYPAAHFV